MATKTNLLNDLQLRRLVAAKEAVAKSDGGGLTFTLSQAGTATWVLRYRHGTRRKEVTLGNYPDLSLAAAREQARSLRVWVDRGIDPSAEKREARSRSMKNWNVHQLVEHFREKELTTANYSETTIYYRNVDFDNVVLPKLGAWQADRITPIDIVHTLIESKRTWLMTKRLLNTLSKLMDHACGLTIIPSNPCTGVKLQSILGKRPQAKKRKMLMTSDLITLLKDIDNIGRENALALMILLATCTRGIELVKAKKSDVDFERCTWWVPDGNVKTRSGFLVPLVPTVMDWFRELFALAGDSQWILPARRADRVERLGDIHVGRTTLWASVRRAFDRGDLDMQRFTPHDTRSTAKGHMLNMGVSRDISEIALNHKLKGMDGIYDVREEIPERRQALEIWARFILECAGHTPPPATRSKPTLRLVA